MGRLQVTFWLVGSPMGRLRGTYRLALAGGRMGLLFHICVGWRPNVKGPLPKELVPDCFGNETCLLNQHFEPFAIQPLKRKLP